VPHDSLPDLVRALEPFRAAPEGAAVMLDFDGTLAPIVDDPARAVPVDGAVEVLSALAARLGVVAVVSGRPAAYLAERLRGAGGVVLAGLYGLERVVGGHVVESPEAARWGRVAGALADRAQAEAPDGVLVERKGPVVALHVRTAPEHHGWIDGFARREAADKGAVVAELGAGCAAVGFFGDDRGDLPAFAALGDLRGRGATTLAVAVDSTEAPPELLAAADVVVDGPPAVLAGLRTLLT
jgi:trehalose 6-phosphate phosphatase